MQLVYWQKTCGKQYDCTGGEISVYSIDGKLIMRKNLEKQNGKESINMRDFPPTTYLIRVSDCYGFFRIRKFIKE